MPTPSNSDLLEMNGWPRGINNRARETEPVITTDARDKIPASQFLREAVNVDLTRFGHPLRRKGYALESSGYTHSLWAEPHSDVGYCVHEGKLCEVSSSGEIRELQDIHAYAPVSYAYINDVVYWINEVERGGIVGGQSTFWAVGKPPAPVLTLENEPILQEGHYRVAFACIDAKGEEYGAVESSMYVPEGKGLSALLTGPWTENAVAVKVFVSRPDGEVLYEIPVELYYPEKISIRPDLLGRGRECETLDLDAPPVGHIVRYYNGRLYVAHKNTVVFTEPLRYGLTRPATNIYMFPTRIRLLEPVVDGIYVGHDYGVDFLQGVDPFDVRQTNVLRHAPIQRAVTHVPGEFMDAAEGDVPVWWGVDGAMVAGMPGGQIKQLTKDRLAVQSFNAGAMMYREQEGMAHVVSSMAKAGEESRLAATDSAVATVRKNTSISYE